MDGPLDRIYVTHCLIFSVKHATLCSFWFHHRSLQCLPSLCIFCLKLLSCFLFHFLAPTCFSVSDWVCYHEQRQFTVLLSQFCLSQRFTEPLSVVYTELPSLVAVMYWKTETINDVCVWMICVWGIVSIDSCTCVDRKESRAVNSRVTCRQLVKYVTTRMICHAGRRTSKTSWRSTTILHGLVTFNVNVLLHSQC